MKLVLFALSCFLLCACASGQGISLLPYQDKNEKPHEFYVCHGFGCSHKTLVQLTDKDWKHVLRPFRKRARNAADERQNIAKAVARMEKVVRKNAGLNKDLAQAETFEKDQHQMDCLDETINTSRTLAFFERQGVLKFNAVADPVHRGYFIDGLWPHNSASVMDKETQDVYVIDSYYSDNGGEVYVVALPEWLNRWRPEHLRPKIIPPKPRKKPKFSI